jgi:hypothetical protein
LENTPSKNVDTLDLVKSKTSDVITISPLLKSVFIPPVAPMLISFLTPILYKAYMFAL